MYATSDQGVYKVDRMTAVCTLLASGGAYPNSLSFVPAGTLDPSVEALVGYSGSTYVRIDTTSGAMTSVRDDRRRLRLERRYRVRHRWRDLPDRDGRRRLLRV